MKIRGCVVTFVLLTVACVGAAHAADAPVYQTPPSAVADILSAPRLPRTGPNLSPDGAWIAQSDLRSLIPIAVLAEPVEKLAGFEILPQLHTLRRDLKAAAAGVTFYNVADGHKVRAQLPADARVGAVEWSNKGDRVACALFAEGGADLWLVDAATGAAKLVPGVKLQGVPGLWMEWSNDDQAVLAAAVDAGANPPGSAARVPAGPAVRQAAGRAEAQRTSRDVLRTPEDQARFAYFVRTQLWRLPVDGSPALKLGAPEAIADVALSPDERWVRVTRFTLPAPVGFPAALFPTTSDLWPLAAGANAAVAFASAPLNSRSAIASTAPLGPREFTWAPDGRSLWAADWEDAKGANMNAAVRDTTLPPPGRDRIIRWDAPFTGAPREVASAQWPVQALHFTSDGAKLFIEESYEPRRDESVWWLSVADPAQRRVDVLRSTEGVYDAPGKLVTFAQRHGEVVRVTADGRSFYRAGEGFNAAGQQPFLDRCAFAGGRPARIFESDAKHLEQVFAVADPAAKSFITLRQSSTEPPNYMLRHAGQAAARPITDFSDPAPALSKAQRFTFEFTRSDGVKLHAEAVLPADWKPGKALPTLFWIYPNDYRSAAAASQNRTSPNKFPSQSALNPEVLITQGYAVIKPDLAIVGTNDQYVSELQKSAQAAVDECVKRGFTDRDRIAVAGHSYGAFSTVNCLAHTKLFRAGLASDGAYNRTLTPFTFQAETRTLWEAKDTYLSMSPFLYANQIDAPLLLAHNQDDTNVGTNPIQSDRLFEALNGLGKTAALVQYPYEDHGPVARETVLDYWSRALGWFDQYVKNAPARAPQSAPRP
jgi:dipeptidyl aminopeptidase/acylaminoacyl peptidase